MYIKIMQQLSRLKEVAKPYATSNLLLAHFAENTDKITVSEDC